MYCFGNSEDGWYCVNWSESTARETKTVSLDWCAADHVCGET
jgi:hypothetical protein